MNTAHKIAGLSVGGVGYGLMGLTWRNNKIAVDEAIKVMKKSLELGANFWNGGDFYGTEEYNSLHLLRDYFRKYPEDGNRVVLSIKSGFNSTTMKLDCSRENLIRCMDKCLSILEERVKIAIFQCARQDPTVEIEESVKAIAEYVKVGKIGGVGLSEANADTIERAVQACPISCVEVELSLFHRDVFGNGISDVCKKYGIPIAAYSPLGRGILTGKIKSTLDVAEQVKDYPWYQKESLAHNLKLVEQLEKLAKRKNVATGQIAIGWLVAMSELNNNPVIIPIPGSTSELRLTENCNPASLDDLDLQEIDHILVGHKVIGTRYPEPIMKYCQS